MNYLAPEADPVLATEAEIFGNFIEKIRAVDPEAVDDETGTIIGRNAATGELMPNATRTTGYYGEPMPAVQGFFLPVPEEEALRVADPAALGVIETEHLNPWPTLRNNIEGEPEVVPLPEWVQPTGAHDAYPLGMWVTHNGYDFVSLLEANVWEPTPESNFWRISPDPGPLPWRQPTGAADAYAIGDRVTHPVAGRETDLWESNIAANTTEPGTDGTFDRWWKPILDAGGEVLPWVQPMPGTANLPYEIGAKVLHNEQEWTSTTQLNVWEPGVFGWSVESPPAAGFAATKEGDSLGKSRQQELAALRRRKAGKFVGDDPATEENEAWLSGEAPE